MPIWQQKRRQRIVRAALALLEEADFDRIQIRDVATRSGFSLGTIYRYFNSKEHVYAAVMGEWARSFETNLLREPLIGDPADRLKEVIRRVIKAFERRPQMLRLERILESSSDPLAFAEFARAGGLNLSRFRDALAGLHNDVATQVVIVVSNVLHTQLNEYALGRRTAQDVERIVAATVDLIFSSPPIVERAAIGPEQEPAVDAETSASDRPVTNHLSR